MNDDYRISAAPAPESRRSGLLRPLLWVLLIVSAAANAVLSTTAGPFVGSAFGAVALACAITLVVHHCRRRSPGSR
jgi:hypothetical protein